MKTETEPVLPTSVVLWTKRGSVEISGEALLACLAIVRVFPGAQVVAIQERRKAAA